MANEGHGGKLLEYFKKNISKGYTEESLKWALIQQGYSRTDISKTIDRFHKEKKQESEKTEKKIAREKPKIKYEVYDKDNRLIKIKMKKPFSLKKFLGDLF
jgi:SOS response regulatory protein OraA/RecX|tara:strand:+ start:400 stop:702 length:303 start_codon:yes stop_codon:yes gene_type:complete